MKKVVAKTNNKISKSEIKTLTDLFVKGFKKIDERFDSLDKKFESEIEALARFTRDGFERVDKRFEGVDKKFENLETKMEYRFELVDTQLSSLHNEQKESNRRLDVIERKQIGVRESFDNVVYKSEFNDLVRKVDMLEKRISKK